MKRCEYSCGTLYYCYSNRRLWFLDMLTHWGRVTHICVGKQTIISSNQTNAGILLIERFGTNFSEISIAIQIFSFKKMHVKMSSAKWHLFCLGLNVLTCVHYDKSLKCCSRHISLSCYDIYPTIMGTLYKIGRNTGRIELLSAKRRKSY